MGEYGCEGVGMGVFIVGHGCVCDAASFSRHATAHPKPPSLSQELFRPDPESLSRSRSLIEEVGAPDFHTASIIQILGGSL